MYISELFETSDGVISPIPAGYATEKDDQSALKLSDVRKTRLTLKQINKLRMINDVRKLEHGIKVKSLSVQYSPNQNNDMM